MLPLQIQCPGCGEHTSPQRFCDHCGANLDCICPACAAPNRAGARFCAQCGTGLAPANIAETWAAAEQKHVTVLFADICGSTGMVETLDPEDASLALDSVLATAAAAIRRLGGVVNKRLGDGVMALFGAPVAAEDHAARACFAALAILEDVAAMGARALPVRVGLCSGPVILRRTGADDEDYEVAGITAHIAARLEQRAEPGAILLAPQTLHLAAGIAETEPLGAIPLRGLARPMEVHRLLGARDLPSWAIRSGRRALSAFIGRAPELAELAAAMHRAQNGQREAIALVGDAGMGKSRLVHEFLGLVPPGLWRIIQAETTAQSAAIPYTLLTALLRHFAGCTPEDPLAEVAARLPSAIEALAPGPDCDLVPLLRHLDPDAAPAAPTPAAHRDDLVRALAPILRRYAERHPVILVIEDYHWLDASSIDLLDALLRRLDGVRLLLLLTTRPERRPNWRGAAWRGEAASAREIELPPLAPEHADALLATLVGGTDTLAPLRAEVVARAGGTPFFLEEFAQSLHEQGVLGEPSEAPPDLSGITIPASVQGILAARIDRLSPLHRRILQVAAVVGRDVPWTLLEAVAGLPAAIVGQAIFALDAARFMVGVTGPGGAVHSFTHALTQSVAYDTLLRSERRTLHERVLRNLESRFKAAPQAEIDADDLAHHALCAEAWPEAARYAMAAGERASRRAAPIEAKAYLETAIAALSKQTPTQATISQGVDVRLSLRGLYASLAETHGQHETLQATLAEADHLAEQAGDRLTLARVYISRSAMLSHWGDLPGAIELSRNALGVMRAFDDPPSILAADFALAQALWYAGDIVEARTVLDTDLTLARSPEGQQRSNATFVLPAVGFLSYLARIQAEMGERAASLSTIGEAHNLATRAGAVFDQVLVDLNQGAVLLALGDTVQAVEALERTLRFAQQTPAAAWHVPSIGCQLGTGWVELGRNVEARLLLEQTSAAADRNRQLARRLLCSPPLVLALAGPPHNDLPSARALAARTLQDAEPRGFKPIVQRIEAALAYIEALPQPTPLIPPGTSAGPPGSR